jgi:hypothetical protein
MTPAPKTQADRALELAIEHAFFLPGSAAHIAAALSMRGKKLHASDVNRIWAEAKAAGRLPRIDRPPGGPRDSADIRIIGVDLGTEHAAP